MMGKGGRPEASYPLSAIQLNHVNSTPEERKVSIENEQNNKVRKSFPLTFLPLPNTPGKFKQNHYAKIWL